MVIKGFYVGESEDFGRDCGGLGVGWVGGDNGDGVSVHEKIFKIVRKF